MRKKLSMVFKIFFLALFLHQSLAEELRNQRDIDARQYNPVKDTLELKEEDRAAKSMFFL